MPSADGDGGEGFQTRLQQIAETIEDFAGHDFSSRAPISPEGDIVDAIAAGVNFLGEELEVIFAETEKRVQRRTEALVKVTEELSHRVMHDELTGLANRSLLTDRTLHRFQMRDRRTHDFALLFADLDGFKTVNDTLGHRAGDQLLIEVAARILGTIRASDTAARVGGDEFVVLLDDVESREAAVNMARRLNRAISRPYNLGGHAMTLTASFGISMGAADAASTEVLIGQADEAMYAVKTRGGNDVALHQTLDSGSL